MDNGKEKQTLTAFWARGFSSAMSILGISTLLFLLLNAGAYLLLLRGSDSVPENVFFKVLPPEAAAGTAVLQRVFGVATSEDALARLRSAPSFEMHPNLHFMTKRVTNPHYRIGLEGIRYDEGWDDGFVQRALAANRNLVFLMGGSTLLGHGVSANETISAHLNKQLQSRALALNLGAQAYDQQREIERLVALLRAGYRPEHVVFLDGWNDTNGLPRSNMRWQDRVIFHGFITNRGEIAFTPGSRLSEPNRARLFLESLPIMQVVNGRERKPAGVADVLVARDPYTHGFDFREADWMFFNWETYAKANADLIRSQMLDYYRHNLVFLEGLSRAFGFKLTVLFQPMGFFDENNPFVPAYLRESFGYRFLATLRDTARAEIKTGRLNMVDLSDALGAMKGDRYIDIAHYAPAANAVLAEAIHAILDERSTDRK
jgi:hypothetical protein